MRESVAVSVRFFAQYREWAGEGRREVELPVGSTVADLLGVLEARTGALPGDARVAVNREYAGEDHPLREGDEVALIPPVSGG